MLPLLHLIQEEKGYISKQAMEWVAEKLEVVPIAVYEVVTFYPMFREKPIGLCHVKVCRTLSCALRGSHKVCEILQKELNCPIGETSSDGNYTLEFAECMACCGTAPVVHVDDQLYENVTPDKAVQLAKTIKDIAKRKRDNA